MVGQFFSVLCTLLFFYINGHLLFLGLLLQSFNTIPIGSFLPTGNIEQLLYFCGTVYSSGLAVAISAICTMLIVNFTMGVMTKAAPQVNVFTLGFAITMIIGLTILTVSLGSFMASYTNNINEVFMQACSLIEASCSEPF